MKKTYKLLEFDKIIEKLKKYIRIEDNLNYLDDITLTDDITIVNKLLEQTTEAKTIIERLSTFEILFKTNVLKLVDKTKKSMILSVLEFIEIIKFLDTIKNLKVFVQNLKTYKIDSPIFSNYVSQLVYLKDFNLKLKNSFSYSGEVLDSASTALKEIRLKINDIEKNFSVKLNQITTKYASYLTQNTITTRNDRYVIYVKNDYKNQIKGFIHDTSSSGETVFIEPIEIFDLNNKLNEYKEYEKAEIERILGYLSSELANYDNDIAISYDILKTLDLIFAKGMLSVKLNCNNVNVNDKGLLMLYDCYHPLLNVEKIVKNDIIIPSDIKGIIITGPNTGGKTVLLKTIGLLSLMVKFGLHLPCKENSNIMVYKDVYSDIGDEQSIDQNLSTFSSHIKNVKSILESVNDKSLVLLDELGSGTDPVEGSSLAIAIFDYLISKNCLVFTSSHYEQLKMHAINSSKILNASVEFDIKTLKPTYKLLMGIPGESNALKICKILGLNEEIINNAYNYAYDKTSKLNESIEKLTNTQLELDHKLNQARDKEYRLNKRIEELDKEKNKINKEKLQIIKNAEEEAKKIIESKTKEIELLLEELKSLKNKEVKQHEISDLTHKYRDIKTFNKKVEKAFDFNKEIACGDNVYIQKFNSYGTVLKINKNKYEILMGNVTLSCNKEDIELTDVQFENYEVRSKKIENAPARKTVSMTLDLRGMRYEEAEGLINPYLSDAYYAGLKSVSIIHGFGTGVIRQLVQSKLKGHGLVKAYRYGGLNEGGQGVTIVDFE